MKVGLIFGTRPEAIKVAPVYHELKNNGIDVKAVVTGQHKEMLYQVLDLFEITPDYDLQIMKQGQGLSELTGRLIIKLDEIIKKEKFDYILVQGDTTSVLAGALAGFYNQIPVGHIEAGLRTGNIYSPFPEEANRKLVGNIADIHFAPTDTNVNNLLKENYPKEKIIKCGNTVIDALYWVKKNKSSDIEKIKEKYNLLGKKYILITMHRRENWGQPMEETLTAVKDYLKEHKDLYLVFPMHLNPLVRNVVHKVLDDFDRKILLEPLEYLEFIAVMDGAHYIMTDSGGVQEEAPSLGKPTLVLRDTTERPEAIEAGTAKLVGTKYEDVTKYMKFLEGELYHQMARANNPYGDGKTSERIRKYLMEYKKENTIQKIPKIIHYCWFGRGEKNQKIKECMKSWEKYLSDYEIIEWNEDNFDINCNQYVKEAYENKKWAFVTDYVRLYALYHYGGIYMDTDVEVLKSLDIFLENKAFSGFEDETHIPTGIMGSVREHIWLEELLKFYKNKHFIENNKLDLTPNTKTITDITKKEFGLILNNKKQFLKDGLILYPKDYFCSKNHYNEKIYLTENTYTIHHFNGSWRDKDSLQKIKKIVHSILILIFGEAKHSKIIMKIKNLY